MKAWLLLLTGLGKIYPINFPVIIDFHIHSKYSFDCFLEPAVIVDLARRNKLDGFAVADHDTMAGIQEFRKLAPDLYIISGQEVTTRDGDILGLFLKEEIKPCKDTQEAIARIRAQGGLAVLAHPFKWPHIRRKDDFLKRFDAVEVFNSRNNIPLPYLENFLCRKRAESLGLSFVAGSDAHEAQEVGAAQTVFDFSKDAADDEKLKDAILHRHLRVAGREKDLFGEVISHFSRNFRGIFKR